MTETPSVLYLIVKRPESKLQHKWRGSELLEFHTNAKAKSRIDKYRDQRMYVKISTRRDIACSVMVDDIIANEDGTFLIKFKDVRRDPWVVPGEIKGTAAGGFVEGRPPVPVPTA